MTPARQGSRLERYHAALRNMPAPGSGRFHRHLLTVANLGRWAGLPGARILDDLIANTPRGKRSVPVREFEAAVVKACAEVKPGHPQAYRYLPRPKPLIAFDPARLEAVIARGRRELERAGGVLESPVPLSGDPLQDARLALDLLYNPEDLLFVGGREQRGVLGRTIRPAREWVEALRRGYEPGPHLLLNPLRGRCAGTGANPNSLRADACVAEFCYALVEFDRLSRDHQLAFFAGTDLPVACVVDSGGRSLHGWLRVRCTSADEWRRRVAGTLFDRVLVPLGADGACRNPARLSRMPGITRPDTGRVQRLLFLNPLD